MRYLGLLFTLMITIGVCSANHVGKLRYFSESSCGFSSLVGESFVISSGACLPSSSGFESSYVTANFVDGRWDVSFYDHDDSDTACSESDYEASISVNSEDCVPIHHYETLVYANIVSVQTASILYFSDSDCQYYFGESLIIADASAACWYSGYDNIYITATAQNSDWVVELQTDDTCMGEVFTFSFVANAGQCLYLDVDGYEVYARLDSFDPVLKYNIYSEPTCTFPDYSATGATSGCISSDGIGARLIHFTDVLQYFMGNCDPNCEYCTIHTELIMFSCTPLPNTYPQKYIYVDRSSGCQYQASDFEELQDYVADPYIYDICITQDFVLTDAIVMSPYPTRTNLRIRGLDYKASLSVSANAGFLVDSHMHAYFENLEFQHFMDSPVITLEPETILSIKGCEFRDNINLGVIYAGTNAIVTVFDSIFRSNGHNNGLKQGGSITAVNAAQLTIIETDFVDSQMNTDDSFGAAIYVENTNLRMEQVSCHDSTYASSGGCLYALNSEVTIVDSNFYNLHSDVNFDDSEMQFRSGKRSGAAIMSLGEKNITISGCDFINNSGRLGVVVYSIQTNNDEPNYSTTARMVIDQCMFNDNIAATGGAIIAAGKMLIQNSVFNGNEAISWVPLAPEMLQGYGGAIMSFGLPISIENCEFNENIADGVGGAIAYSDWFEGASMELNDCKLSSNIGRFGAGAISYFHSSIEEDEKPLSQVSLTISDTEFFTNIADDKMLVPNVAMFPELVGRGGAIAIIGKINVTISNCLFDGDIATESGSVIFAMAYINTQKIRFTIEDTRFIQQEPLDIPIVQLLGISSLLMRKCTMFKQYENFTTSYVSFEGGPGVFNACTFSSVAQGASSAVIVAVTEPDQKASNNIQIAMGNCLGLDVAHVSNVIMRNADALLTFNTSYTSELELVEHIFDTNDILLFCRECEQRNPFLCNAVDFCSLPVEQQASIISVWSVESVSSYIQASSSSAAIFLSSILEDPEASSVYISSSNVQYSIRSRLSAISYQESTSAYEWSNSQKDDKDDGFNIILAAAAGGGGLLLLLLLILVLRRRQNNKDKKSNTGESFLLDERSLSGSVMPMMTNPSSQSNDQKKAAGVSSAQSNNDYEALQYDEIRPPTSNNLIYADVEPKKNSSQGQEVFRNDSKAQSETNYAKIAPK